MNDYTFTAQGFQDYMYWQTQDKKTLKKINILLEDIKRNGASNQEMIALKITNIKQFMGKFLTSDIFDRFLLESAEIATYNTFTIDGHQNRAFYSTEEWEDSALRPYDFSTWKTIRPICFDLIKGTHTPASFRFVLHLNPENTETLLKGQDCTVSTEQIKAFVLNVRYDGLTLVVVTGTSYHTFLQDKTPDQLWDRALKQFLTAHEISYEEQL